MCYSGSMKLTNVLKVVDLNHSTMTNKSPAGTLVYCSLFLSI